MEIDKNEKRTKQGELGPAYCKKSARAWFCQRAFESNLYAP
jgi:hypothetical protein